MSKTTTKTKKEPKYKLELSFNGETTKLEGDDIYEMLTSIPQPPALKTDMDIKLPSGKFYIVNVRDARRTFNNGTKMKLLAITLTKMIG